MVQPQSGLLNPTRTGGPPPGNGGEYERPIRFQFVITWSALRVSQDAPAKPSAPVLSVPERSRPVALAATPLVMPAPQPTPLAEPPRSYADQLVPVKKSPGPGFQWEMVVPKMARTAKKPAGSNASRGSAAAANAATATAIPQDTPPPNLYTGSSSFRKSFSFKVGLAVAVLGAASVPLWRHAAHPAPDTATSIEGGDWVREAAVAGDPGFKQARQLVLYRPALKSTESRLEFDWTVSSSDVGWVFRAKDLGDYYAVRLKVLRPGANPTLSAEFFSVYQFVESPHNEKILVFSRNDPVLHVRMDISGPTFTLYLQNNATAYWTDARLVSGAVGFFEEWNRGAEIHNVRMSFPQRSGLLHGPDTGFLALYEPRLATSLAPMPRVGGA